MIKLVDIHKIFENGATGFLALKNVNLDFTNNHFVCILGKSGSGKTTLLNIIGGLDRASSGHMVINGVLTTKFTETQWDYFRNHKIGFIFQNYSLIEHLTVLDNVMLGAKLQGIDQKTAKEKALDLLNKVHIVDHANKLPKELSGGERQRVSIARALINDPDVILADEPTGALDKKTSKDVLDLLKELSQDKLVIMVTHSKRLANLYAERIIELKDGEVIHDSNPDYKEKVKITRAKNNPTKFTLKDKIKHAFKNIKMKKWRSFLTSLGLAIGITGFILINALSNGIKVNYEKQMNAFNNNPNLIFNKYDSEGGDQVQIINSYLETLQEDDRIKLARLNKEASLQVVGLDGFEIDNYQYEPFSYLYVDMDNEEDVRRYLGELHGDGRWPEADDEIVISRSLAENLYDYDRLTLLWEKLEGAKLELVTSYYYEVPIYYLVDHPTCNRYPYIDENTAPEGYDQNLYGSYTDQLEMQKRYFNTLILEDEQYIWFCPNYDDMPKNINYEMEMTKEFTIVGINESNRNTQSYMTKNAYFDVQSQHKFGTLYAFDIFLEDDLSDDDLFDLKVDYREDFDVYENPRYQSGLNNLSLFNVAIGLIEFIISVIMFVSVVTAGIMLLMVLLISVIERGREIGILRSLGATKSDILSIFTVESGLIGFFAGVIGNVLAIIIAFGGNLYIRHAYSDELINMFNSSQINLIIIKPWYGIIALVVSIFLAMLFGLIPAISASKKPPINAVKRIR
jgi:putative ABC transport system permease protein